MPTATHETVREREIAEARKKLEDLHAQREDIDQQIKAQELIVQAWNNFELTLQGKFQATPTRAPSQRKATGTRAPRGAGGEMQNKILVVVEKFPGQATAELINTELEATDAEAKKPIAAALFRMKKSGVLLQPKSRGPYLIPTPTREVFEPPAGR